MSNLPTEEQLNILWSVATSSAIECDAKAHIIFARLLFNEFNQVKPIATLRDD